MAVDEPALDPLLVFNPNMCCAETLDREQGLLEGRFAAFVGVGLFEGRDG